MSKKRPSVIVMKRLDTQGMRVLSQSAGEGTRRAGVRLSPRGGLIVHQRGEPITGAPPPAGSFETREPSLVDASAPTMLDPVMFIPNDVRAFAKAALEEQLRAPSIDAQTGRLATTTDAPLVAAMPLPALTIAPAPRRSSMTLWTIALMTLGVLTGITIARAIGDSRGAIPSGDSPSDVRAERDSNAYRASVPASAPLLAVDLAADASVTAPQSARAGQSL